MRSEPLTRFRPVLFSMLAASLLLAGCNNGKETSDKETSSSNMAGGEKVIAVVNGNSIDKSAFDAYLKSKNIPGDKQELIEKEKDRYLQREALAGVMLQQEILDASAIESEVNEFRKQAVISRYMEAYLKDKVSDEAVRNFYSANAERFQSRKVHAAHILIRTNAAMSQSEREAMLTRAHEVYSRANTNEDFGKLAQEFSEDKVSAKKSGDLGWLQEGAIDAAFSNRIFAMKKGEISEPIVTPFGFHIVKIHDEAQVVTKPFDSVKGDIRYELRQAAKQAELERLRKLVTVEKKS